MSVVVNASVGPRVIGSMPSGSGAFMISSTRWFCHVVSTQATTNASRLMISRLRSSSR
jgi:hypothetical protein